MPTDREMRSRRERASYDSWCCQRVVAISILLLSAVADGSSSHHGEPLLVAWNTAEEQSASTLGSRQSSKVLQPESLSITPLPISTTVTRLCAVAVTSLVEKIIIQRLVEPFIDARQAALLGLSASIFGRRSLLAGTPPISVNVYVTINRNGGAWSPLLHIPPAHPSCSSCLLRTLIDDITHARNISQMHTVDRLLDR